MKLSKRIQNINPSATMAFTERVAEMRQKGIDVIAFNVGEPDFDTPENIRNAGCAAINSGKTRYTPVAGILDLRRVISEKLKKDNGLDYPPEAVSVGTGAKQPLCNAVLALCEEGDEVILPTPCWVSYIEMIKLAGATPVLVPTRAEDGFALDVSAIEKAVTDKTVAVLINTPNNPTGAVYSEESLRALAKVALDHDLMVISDEVYEKLVYNGKRHFSIGAVSPEMLAHTVTINGVSKAYAMTGWRIGYAAGPLALIKGINKLQGHATSNPSSIAQYASVEAIGGSQESVETMRVEFDRRRQMLVARLNAMEGVTCPDADGAFYLMPNLSYYFGKTAPDGTVIRNDVDLADYLLNEAHIAVVQGSAFEYPAAVRISYSNSYEALNEGMRRMEEALKKLK